MAKTSKFKIDGELYESRKADLKTVIEHYGENLVAQEYAAKPVQTLFSLYHKVWFDRRNADDSHPNYRNRPRLLDHDPSFELYPNDSDDSHIKTMVKRALYELIPETKKIDQNRLTPSGLGR